VQHYAAHLASGSGEEIVCLAESALAIMQACTASCFPVPTWHTQGDLKCFPGASVKSRAYIVQGRWRHYRAVKPSWLAKLGCWLFHPLSSMASACGLQAAIMLVGKLRVLLALLLGAAARLVGLRGVFYRVVGAEATAIDDLTGTLPPFDRFLVFGPVQAARVVKDIEVAL
jgi:hypothetical protein